MLSVTQILCLQLLFSLCQCDVRQSPRECESTHYSEQDEDDENALLQVGNERPVHLGGKLLAQRSHDAGKELVSIPAIGLAKVHKTGSTTMQRITQNLMTRRGSRLMFPVDYKHLGWPEPFPGVDNLAAIGSPEHQYDAIVNHAIFNAKRYKSYLKPNPLLVGGLREPMAQAKSAYNYFRIQIPSQQLQNGKVSEINIPTWEEHLDALETQCSDPVERVEDTAWYCNPQSYDLGWYEHVGWTTKYDNNVTAIKQWIEALDSQLSNMILTEAFDQGLVLLRESLNVDINELAYFRQMEGRVDVDPPQDEKFQKRLREQYRVDLVLYDHFNKSFWSRWNSRAQDHEDQLAALKKANDALNSSCFHCEKNSTGCVGCDDVWTAGSVEYLQMLQKNEPASIASLQAQ